MRCALRTSPPVTANAASRNVLKLSPATSSLNVSPNVKRSPVCSPGTPLKLAVSRSDGSGGSEGGSPSLADGPLTVAEGLLVNCRRGLLLVQIAPETPHSRPAGSVIVTAPSESGRTVILNRSRRPSTRLPPVTRPPVTVNASSRKLR